MPKGEQYRLRAANTEQNRTRSACGKGAEGIKMKHRSNFNGTQTIQTFGGALNAS